MIMTDPKGELFSLHSKYLQSRGYNAKTFCRATLASSANWLRLE